MCKFIMFYLSIMAGPQLLQIAIARLMLLFLQQLSPGEDLHCNPHRDISLKKDCACSLRYFRRLALCQRRTLLILSLCFLEGFSFTVWWNANPLLCMFLLAVQQRCPVLPLTFWLSGGVLVMCIRPWNWSVGLYLGFLTEAVAVAKEFVRFSVNSCQFFFKVSYLFGAPFEGTFFSLNKELQKQINQQTCGCLNYSLQLQSSNCKYTATSTTVL